MELIDLTVNCFRNLENSTYHFGTATNVILGGNGAGKTSLLEAIVVLGNLRTFRTSSLRRVVRHGENVFQVAGSISVSGRTHRLVETVDVGPPIARSLSVDSSTVDVQRYLQLFPVFAITGNDRDLVEGYPKGRRAFLDRFAFLLRPGYLEDLRGYRRALRQRNAALAAGSSNAEIEAWEAPLAAAASRVVEARTLGTEVLAELFVSVWNDLSPEGSPRIILEYRSEPWSGSSEGLEKVEELYRKRYNETRTRDRQIGFTVDGPHRHDLSIKTNGRSVRHELSSGQTKRVAAALRLATLAQVEKDRNERFPVIVDDVDAEFDGPTLALLVQRLGGERQLFLSSANERVADLVGSHRHRIRLQNGAYALQEAVSDEQQVHR